MTSEKELLPNTFSSADVCEECEGVFIGVSRETKWCPYCGHKHEGTTVELAPALPASVNGKAPEAVCEVADEKYNRVIFYRRTGDTTKPYHQPGAKLYDQACVDQMLGDNKALQGRVVVLESAIKAAQTSLMAREYDWAERELSVVKI